MAHAAVFQIDHEDDVEHGPHWKAWMIKAGLPPNARAPLELAYGKKLVELLNKRADDMFFIYGNYKESDSKAKYEKLRKAYVEKYVQEHLHEIEMYKRSGDIKSLERLRKSLELGPRT
jgi:hypothetical protein